MLASGTRRAPGTSAPFLHGGYTMKRAASSGKGSPKKLKMGIDAGKANHNADLCKILMEMANIEKAQGQLYKAKAYRQAVDSLKGHNSRIASAQDARKLPGVGAKIAAKIEEILNEGKLTQLDNYNEDPVVRARRTFTNISGVGPVAAQKFVDKGYTTLQDLVDNGEIEHFTAHQKLGVQYYDDFLKKIPYDEVALIAKTALDVARSRVDSELILTACGSHRRQKPLSGDIDCLLTQPLTSTDSGEEYLYLKKVTAALRDCGLIIDTISEGSTKVMAVCKPLNSPADAPARRIDIRFVPYDSYGPALLYFTGSSMFNTQMRTEALKVGYTLNEYGLYKLSKEDIATGSAAKATKDPSKRVKTESEKDVFDIIGIEYCNPEDRDL